MKDDMQWALQWTFVVLLVLVAAGLMWLLGGCTTVSDHYGSRDRDMEQLQLCEEYAETLTDLARQRAAGLLSDTEVSTVDQVRPELNADCQKEGPEYIDIMRIERNLGTLKEIRDAN